MRKVKVAPIDPIDDLVGVNTYVASEMHRAVLGWLRQCAQDLAKLDSEFHR